MVNLADVARKTGYKVIEVNGWQNRGHGALGKVETIVCHHTAGPAKGDFPSLSVVRDGRAGLPGPLCNIGLARSGEIYIIAAGLAYHAGAVKKAIYGNSRSIGIEAENTGTGEKWNDKQMDSYAKLCAELVKAYGLEVGDVLGHKEVCAPVGRKIDPSFDITMAAFRKKVSAALSAGGSAKASGSGSGSTSLNKKAVVKAHQEMLKRAGYKNNKVIDGIFGELSVKDTQEWMQKKGYYKKTVVAKWGVKKGVKLKVDGGDGKWFWYEFERLLKDAGKYKGVLDGVPGPMFWNAWAGYLHV